MAKNPFAKTVKKPYEKNAYEIWQNVIPYLDCPVGSWTWYVLKKWQIDDNKPYARWYCLVKTPMEQEEAGTLGDVYVKEIKAVAHRIDNKGKKANNAGHSDIETQPNQVNGFAERMEANRQKLEKDKFAMPDIF